MIGGIFFGDDPAPAAAPGSLGRLNGQSRFAGPAAFSANVDC